jgi:hypothetical protein
VSSLRPVEKWTAAFDGGPTDLVNFPRSGRLRETGTVDAVHALIEDERYLSQKKIAQMPRIHHDTVKDILRDDLNMLKVNFKWVPHALNSFHKPVRA